MRLIDAARCVSDRQEDLRDTSFSGNVVTDFITPLPSLLLRYRLYFITTPAALRRAGSTDDALVERSAPEYRAAVGRAARVNPIVALRQ